MDLPRALTAAALLTLTLAGCASFERNQGVTNSWRDAAFPTPEVGKTTKAEVLDLLGPPSQIIGLRDQTVFYYLKEQRKGKGAILILFNWIQEDTTYDRAIFFFDQNGVLKDYAFSNESIAP